MPRDNRTPDEKAEAAAEFLASNYMDAAKARAERLYLEEFTKHLKAQIMAEHLDLPVNAQEREAYADPRYKEHLDGLREAIKRDESMRFAREGAHAAMAFWQTTSANTRGLK